MNLNKFEKIDGREALRKLLDGENIYVDENTYVHLPIYNDLQRVDIVNGKPMSEDDWISITEFVEYEWFVKKPFDVRQAMTDRPNEWVGAFKPSVGQWMKVGFNELRFGVSVRPLKEDGVYLPSHGSNDGYGVTESQLNKCIPIEDVPEEATR